MKRYAFVYTLRTLLKNKFSTLINMFGLSVGVAVVLLISVYLYNELATDKFHKNYESVYRFGATNFNGTADMPGPLADMVIEKIPEIGLVSRIDFSHSWGMDISYNNEHLNIKGLIFADSTFFRIFTFRSLQGNVENALNKPNSIVITRSLAQRLFGNEEAIGKQILLKNNEHLAVSAVIEDIPNNSSIDFEGVITLPVLKKISGDDYSKAWGNFNYETFCTTRNHDISNIEAKVNEEFQRVQPERNETIFSLQPFREIYFYNQYNDDSLKHGSLQTLIFLGISVLLIVVLAVINYINLSIANISSRLKSVGIQKIIGAQKRNIYQRFFYEAVGIVFASGLLGVLLAKMFLPVLNHLTASGISNYQLINYKGVTLILFFLVALAALSSYIPFVVINNQNLQAALKNQLLIGKKKSEVKYVLVAFQFMITIVLITVTIAVNKQIHYINTKDLGFKKDDATILFFLEEEPTQNFNLLKNQLSQYPQFKAMNLSHSSPGTIGMQWGGDLTYRGKTTSISYFSVPVTPGYLEMMGYRIKEGRFFSDSLLSDKGCFILNETAAKKYGIAEAPMEARIENMGDDVGRIIGVVKDFNFESLREQVKPLAFCYVPQWGDMCSLVNIRVSSEELAPAKNIIQTEYKKLFPEKAFECFTINDLFTQYYVKDNNLNKIITVFSLLSILIGCLGLIGIVNITIASKIKEIGVRKVNGAHVTEIMLLFNRDFVKWVIIAFIVALPIAYYVVNKWLEGFSYKTDLSWWVFVVAGLLALGIALLTVTWQSWKAATRNPVEALRYE
jgi:putative ABC transport system permease protein